MLWGEEEAGVFAKLRLDAALTRLEGTEGLTKGDGVGIPKDMLYPTPILDCVKLAVDVAVEVVGVKESAEGGRLAALLWRNCS